MRIIVSHASEMSRELLKAIYVFRAKIFHHRLKWSVPIVDDQEIDRFDSLDPLWVVVEEQGEVQGCWLERAALRYDHPSGFVSMAGWGAPSGK